MSVKVTADIKTGQNVVAKGVCKTLGFEAQTGCYSLLWHEAQSPSGPATTLPPGWQEQWIRASSVWNWVDCPMRAASETNYGLRKLANSRMHLGTTIHAGTAVYDSAVVASERPSVSDSISHAVEVLWHPEEEIDWQEETPRKLEPIARECVRKYCGFSKDNLSFTGVEEKLADLPVDIPEYKVRLLLTGTQDRLRRTVRGSDVDGGKSFAEIIGIRTTKNPEIAIGKVIEPEKVLLGDETHGGYLKWIAHMVSTGDFIGNPRSMFCNKRSCAIFPCFYARGGME